MIVRYTAALTTGALMTLALLFAMQGLIHLQPGSATAARERTFLDFLPPARPEEPPRRQEQPIDPEILKHAPVPPAGPVTSGPGTNYDIPVTHSGPGTVSTKLDKLGQPDGPLISIVRVQPSYPGVAEARGIEGWVDVRFDVTTAGQAVNVVVTSSSHRIFESAAVKAIARFRFRAPVVDGVPHVATGVEYRFRFDLNDR
jgi:periplasmic protein TonB